MKTRNTENFQEWPQVLQIPKNIQDDITERWFHLYKWISPEEVKFSIQRDFMKALSVIWNPLAIISVLAGLITWINILVFLWVIFIWIIFLFLYLFFLSIRRSFLLSKSAFVILTDSSVSLGGKIVKLSEFRTLWKDMKKVSDTFEEDLFWESQLSNSHNKLSKEVMNQLFGWYKAIFSGTQKFSRSGLDTNDVRVVLLLVGLYTVYIAIMACVYFIWVFFLLIFLNILTWANTKYLHLRGHSVVQINTLFWKLDISSEDLKSEKIILEDALSKAIENQWKDGLLLNISSGINKITWLSEEAIIYVQELKKAIKKSDYKDMFSFPIYNAWIKKQIISPLVSIETLLEVNKNILNNTHLEISAQIEQTPKVAYNSPLKIQLTRIEIQQKEIDIFIPRIQASIKKLQ